MRSQATKSQTGSADRGRASNVLTSYGMLNRAIAKPKREAEAR